MGLRIVEMADEIVECRLQRREAAVLIFFQFGIIEINDKFVVPYKTLVRSSLFAFPAWKHTFPPACPLSSRHSRNEVRSPFHYFCCSFHRWRVRPEYVDYQHTVSIDHCFSKNAA